MDVRQIIGVLVILGAYGLTWLLLFRSLRIVKIIDKEGLNHAGEIKARLRLGRIGTQSAERSQGEQSGESGESDGNGQ